MNQRHILVVDDDKNLQNLLALAFRGTGFRVSTADSGEKALVCFDGLGVNETIDLMITDVIMPRMDGVELIRRVRNRNISIPIIAMTGYGNAGLGARLQEYGVNGYLDKPFTISDLISRMSELLEGEHLQDEKTVGE
jgi:two-component system, NtrC family, response regulator GlrR